MCCKTCFFLQPSVKRCKLLSFKNGTGLLFPFWDLFAEKRNFLLLKVADKNEQTNLNSGYKISDYEKRFNINRLVSGKPQVKSKHIF